MWQRLHHVLLDQLGRRGQLDWSRASVDSLSVRANGGELTEQAQAAAGAGAAERMRVARRLRGELRRIARRDFFPPPERDAARAAVDALAAAAEPAVSETGP